MNQPQFHAICKVTRDGQPEEHAIRTAGYFEILMRRTPPGGKRRFGVRREEPSAGRALRSRPNGPVVNAWMLTRGRLLEPCVRDVDAQALARYIPVTT